MPTDEQRMREQFEDWGRTYYLNLIRTRGGRYRDVLTEAAYAAWRARDAEVQALRVQGYQLHRMVSFFASSIKSGEQWSAYHEEEMAALRAALAGGETGEAE